MRNLLNFFSLRTDSHAQFEIREYAKIMVKMVEDHFPITINAWRDYMKNAVTFSAPEKNVIKTVLQQSNIDIIKNVSEYLEKNTESVSLAKLEIVEFLDKLRDLTGLDSTLNFLGKDS
jgi:thymidylate synthase (FAD)